MLCPHSNDSQNGGWYRYRLYCAWVIALLGLLASLTFSELLHIDPCSLCWYQRSALFPLVWILGIAAYRDDQSVAIYVVPLALAGALLALYQLVMTAAAWGACATCTRGENPLLALVSAAGFCGISCCFCIKKT